MLKTLFNFKEPLFFVIKNKEITKIELKLSKSEAIKSHEMKLKDIEYKMKNQE